MENILIYSAQAEPVVEADCAPEGSGEDSCGEAGEDDKLRTRSGAAAVTSIVLCQQERGTDAL